MNANGEIDEYDVCPLIGALQACLTLAGISLADPKPTLCRFATLMVQET
jgi:hypothetical protein